MDDYIARCAQEFSEYYIQLQKARWAMGDVAVLCEARPQGLLELREELAGQFGITIPVVAKQKPKKLITLQTLKNYAEVAKSFGEEDRHYQYKWSNYLEWAKHPDPIEAMKMALDNCYSPGQMRNLRKHGDPDHKIASEKCASCGGALDSCIHESIDEANLPHTPEAMAGGMVRLKGGIAL